ncbi:MAG: hypothetical protein CMO01_23865 [Thalassobius sp.]|nr:hypothetical protein [Thalassovita sp.]
MLTSRLILIFCIWQICCIQIGFATNIESTPNIKIAYEGYKPNETEALKIKNAITFLHHYYKNKLGLQFSKDLKIKLRIFGDYYSYKIYQLGFSRSTTDGAFYSSKFDEAVVWKRKDAEILLKDICHEVSHLLVGNLVGDKNQAFKKRPLWINEGLSEYFENLDIEFESIKVQPNVVKLERCREWLLKNEMVPLSDYLGFSNKEWKENDGKENVYQSRTIGWSLMYFIFSKPEGAEIVGKMLKYMVANQYDENNAYKAVELLYPGGVKAIEHDWKFWLLQNSNLVAQEVEKDNNLFNSPNKEANILQSRGQK